MAEFKIHELEGTRYVDVHLNHEMVRVEAGAFNCHQGDIAIHSRSVPSLDGPTESLLADEAVFRPAYFGTGVITLESTFGGFYILDLRGESWILERGTYWASEGSVDVSYHRERLATAMWADEGPVYLQTRVRGHGKVVLTTCGPVEEIELGDGKELATEGKHVIARTGNVTFQVRRSTNNSLGRFTAGEGLVRVYQGTGKVLFTPAPYGRYRVFTERGRNPDVPSQATASGERDPQDALQN